MEALPGSREGATEADSHCAKDRWPVPTSRPYAVARSGLILCSSCNKICSDLGRVVLH